jgi:hypothetical protein
MATTAKELIENIKKWFPDENELVHSLGIVSKQEFMESAHENHDLPENWVMPDDVFQTISSGIDGCDNSLEHLWEDITAIASEAIQDYIDETSKEQELWEA